MKQGIYLIENLINHKKYIGQSIHIEKRWKDHQTLYKDHFENCPLLYKAFEKYGVQNFSFSILEEVADKNQLTQKETEYIILLNTLSPNGYNCVLPSELNKGINNYKNKLTLEQVNTIKFQLKNTETAINVIAEQYQVAFSTIYRINKGEIWSDSNESYPLRLSNDLARKGSDNGRAIFSEEEVYEIRKKYVNHTVNELYIDYKDKCSLSGFKKIVQGTTFTNVPIYRKSLKQWM